MESKALKVIAHCAPRLAVTRNYNYWPIIPIPQALHA